MTMTHQQAADRTTTLVNDTVAVLTSKPRLELYQPLSGDTNCQTSVGNSSLVTTAKTYQLQDIPESDNAAIGTQVLAYWQKQGYKINQSTGIGTEQPNINAQTSDGFQLSLETGGGLLSLGATSPCVQP